MKTRKIMLKNTHLLAVGPYSRDREYAVPEAQAAHLVAHRGFVYVDAPEAPEAPPPKSGKPGAPALSPEPKE